MSLKTSAFLAIVALALLSVLLIWQFARTVIGVADGALPLVNLVPAVVYAFAAIALTLFFFVFRSSRS